MTTILAYVVYYGLRILFGAVVLFGAATFFFGVGTAVYENPTEALGGIGLVIGTLIVVSVGAILYEWSNNTLRRD